MKKYVCPTCGYIYNPDRGDRFSDVAPGCDFGTLPTGWCCPVCRCGKTKFVKEEDEAGK